MFTLHPRLERDGFFLKDLALCRVLLMNNRFFPWIVLVPRIDAAREIIDLSPQQRHLLMDEIAVASRVMQKMFEPEKLNVAALGNQVPQLHVHVIARFARDPAWPHPVWGRESEPYADPKPLLQKLENALLQSHITQ